MSSLRPTQRLPRPGTVYLVGAGPGDPELMTVRGLRCLQHADTLLYDRLLDPALLAEAPATAERIFVGKAPGRPGVGQEGIHRLLIEHARQGKVVVRLKGGDPFVFGRGGEEALALGAADIPWEVVPGITSAVSVPSRVGIPVTHRGIARGFAVVTAHQLGEGGPPWSALAQLDTLVVLMGVAAVPRITQALIAEGREPNTPAALVERGTLPGEKVLVADLGTIARRAREEGVRSPAILVIGEVVALREMLNPQLLAPADQEPVPALAEVLPWPAERFAVPAGVGRDAPPIPEHPMTAASDFDDNPGENLTLGAR